MNKRLRRRIFALYMAFFVVMGTVLPMLTTPVQAATANELEQSMTIPENPNGTYFSFDKYDVASPGKLQVPHDASVRGSFDTLQIIEDIKIPNGDWGKANYLEPITKDFPQFGPGGATQVVTKSPIVLNDITKLPK